MLRAVQNRYEATRSWFPKATRFPVPSILVVLQPLGISITLWNYGIDQNIITV